MVESVPKRWRWIGGLFLLALLGITGCIVSAGDVTGARAKSERLKKMQTSPQWDAEKQRFANELPRVDGSFLDTFGKFFFGGSSFREPEGKLAVSPVDKAIFATPPQS